MLKEKKIWIMLFIVFTLIVIFTGCSSLPKTAKVTISITPNPVPYDPVDQDWPYELTLGESNGVGVTLVSLRMDKYDQEEELFDTQLLHEEDIVDWFDSNYLPAFSSLQVSLYHTSAKIIYELLTLAGIDDNDNSIEATYRVDFLPE